MLFISYEMYNFVYIRLFLIGDIIYFSLVSLV